MSPARRAWLRLQDEGTDLAEETFAPDVTPCRLIAIEARLLQIEAEQAALS